MVEEPELAQIKSFLGDSHRYIVQPFRNVSVLDPDLRGATEFDMGRVQRMKSIYEAHPVKRMAS
jgi:hypothetical protein